MRSRIATILLAACTSSPLAAMAADLAADPEEMYAIVIERLIMVDNSFGRSLNRDEIFVEREHQTHCPTPNAVAAAAAPRPAAHSAPADCTGGPPPTLDQSMQAAIQARLRAEGLNIQYIDNFQTFFLSSGEPQERPRGSIGLSRAILNEEGAAVVTGRIWFGVRTAIENRYVFQREAGRWKLVSTTMLWIA